MADYTPAKYDAVYKLTVIGDSQVGKTTIIRSCYFRGAHGVVLVYDVTQIRTFDNIQFHLSQARQYTGGEQPMIMVGNKCDLVEKRAVPFEVAASYAEDFGIQLVETSALSLTNVDQVFLRLIHEIRSQKKDKGSES
nr:hypothetical protein BaRGS_020661 [Batillaria attramentaria]